MGSYGSPIIMVEKIIIDKEKYKKFKVLIQGDEETSNLVINLIDNCDIHESMPYIIPLINAGYDLVITGASKLFKSKNLFDYIVDILGGDVQNIPAMHDLNWLINLYKEYCTVKGLLPDNHHIKFITVEYHTEGRNKNPLQDAYQRGSNDFKLNPKKNVRRKN